jgi:hypothetical protein
MTTASESAVGGGIHWFCIGPRFPNTGNSGDLYLNSEVIVLHLEESTSGKNKETNVREEDSNKEKGKRESNEMAHYLYKDHVCYPTIFVESCKRLHELM